MILAIGGSMGVASGSGSRGCVRVGVPLADHDACEKTIGPTGWCTLAAIDLRRVAVQKAFIT
jgi:hypothetical protein